MTFCQFLSTPSARRATGRRSAATGHPPDFYPRPPQGGRRFSGLCLDLRIDISIHALRKEGDRQRRTAYESESISIHALRKEGDPPSQILHQALGDISIHALRKEGDRDRCRNAQAGYRISIHALRKEGDPLPSALMLSRKAFLSTPSARRATKRELHPRRTSRNFYPRPPQGGRPSRWSASWSREQNFYPRPPQGGRQRVPRHRGRPWPISIHALRKEGDSKNGEKHLRFCFIIKRSAQIWKSLSKNIRKNSCDLHKTA